MITTLNHCKHIWNDLNIVVCIWEYTCTNNTFQDNLSEDIEEVLFGRDEDEFDSPITKQKVIWHPIKRWIDHTYTMVKYLIHGLYDKRISMKISLFLLTNGGQGHRGLAKTFPQFLPTCPWSRRSVWWPSGISQKHITVQSTLSQSELFIDWYSYFNFCINKENQRSH